MCVCVCVCVCVWWEHLKSTVSAKFSFLAMPKKIMASGILQQFLDQESIIPVSPVVEVQRLNHWTTREVPKCIINYSHHTVHQISRTHSSYITATLYPLTNISLLLFTSSPWQPPFYSLLLWVWLTVLNLPIIDIIQYFLSESGFSLSLMPSSFIYIVSNGRISFSRLNDIPIYIHSSVDRLRFVLELGYYE